uniref:Werner Syndrome-like exonuclease n=1 Tax=Anthurium amnicola TaxID=1678845 RepID=A0A1D1Z6Q4_9ARAE
MAMKGGRGPVEITMRRIEEDEPEEDEPEDDASLGAYALQFGDRQIAVTNAGYGDADVTEWIRGVQRVHRERLRGGLCSAGAVDLVVGLCTFRRKPSLFFRKGTKKAAGADNHPIAVMSLCSGGHCLVLPVEDDEHGRCSYQRHPFSHPLAAFLGGRRTRFVGIGIKAAAERLERVWGVRLGDATELRPLVARAFGRQAVPPLKGGGGDADGLRKMAAVALKGVDAGKKPAAIEFNDWGCALYSRDEIMYAAVDAFLSCEIAEASFHEIAHRPPPHAKKDAV